MLSLGLLGALLVLAAPQDSPPHHQHQHEEHPIAPSRTDARSPYVENERQDIKALSEEEIRSLREGTGHGMAIPAELNHYPGPRHVLDLGSDLGLTEAQISQIRAIFDRMHARAVSLGEQIIERERALDRAFSAGTIGETNLRGLIGEIGRLRGDLRATHLAAHLETRAVLRPEQIARYDALRGYVQR